MRKFKVLKYEKRSENSRISSIINSACNKF